ncbi:MAG: DNA replication/repair protein RecF [Gammaproteobacteria bacterium]|nr:DNA replication/repair protein RecF [Gammaproteobacteria bacterium]
MALKYLSIQNFRNFKTLNLELSEGFNYFVGANGAGKTSILESIYYLGHARSFRTRKFEKIVQHETSSFIVHGKIDDPNKGVFSVGIESKKGKQKIHINGQSVQQVASLASKIPIQLIDPDSHNLLQGGPKFRRRFLDWGVFHVEPSFFLVWQRFMRALRQRNAVLRTRAGQAQISAWDNEISESAEKLHQLRSSYINNFSNLLICNIKKIFDCDSVDIQYRSGWAESSDYQAYLQDNIDKDMDKGFTRYGPHRADLVLTINDRPVQEYISRGQQKLLTIAMLITQAVLFSNVTNKQCLFLVDDLSAELDEEHRRRVLSELAELNAQVFITTVNEEDVVLLDLPQKKVFHVKHGIVV